MPYPNTILTRPVRICIMVFLIISFLIISPTVILYTAGYRYDWENNEIKQTGVISVDVEPDDASIYLNDVKIDKDIPARLSNRAPGTYHISLKKKGYKTWTKDITVESKKTTYINNITLIKDQLPIHIDELKIGDKTSFYPAESSPYTILVKNKKEVYEVILLNLTNNNTTLLTRTSKKPKVEWSPHGSSGIIITETQEGNQVQLFSTNSDNLGQKYSFDKIDYHWITNTDQVHFKDNNKIYQVGLNKKQAMKSGVSTNTIWYLQNDDLWTFDQENNRLIKNGKILENFSYDIEKFLQIDSNRILALTTDNDIAIISKVSNKITNSTKINADKYQTLSNKEIIAWSPWELWKIDSQGNTQLLNRTSEYIKDIQELSEENLILVHTKQNLKAFNTHYFVTQHLFKNGKIKKTAIDQENQAVFLWGKIGKKKGLFKLKY